MAFLVFEGIDGAGKSSLIRSLEKVLDEKSLKYETTREPGGTPLGEELREVLLRTTGPTPLPRAEALLYQVIRAQHVEEKIIPLIEKKQWVLCDRFTASSIAFQSGGRDISTDDIRWLNRFSTQNIKPDLFVLLNLPVEEAERRMSKRSNETEIKKDRFELEKAEFHTKVRDTYLDLARSDSENWLVLDATLPTEDLLAQLLKKLEDLKCF